MFDACDKGDCAGVQQAIARGANPLAANALGQNALFYAASPAVADVLMDLGLADAVDHTGATAVTRAMTRDKEVFRALVARLAVLAGSPLHAAAEIGDWEACEVLAQSGKVAVDAKDEKGLTPLLLGARTGSVPTAERLIEHADASATDGRGRNALHLAVIGGHVDLARFLSQSDPEWAEQRDAEGKTPLRYAGDKSEMREALLGEQGTEKEEQEATAASPAEAAPGERAATLAGRGGHRLMVFEDDVLDVQSGGGGELEVRANAFFDSCGERVAVVSSSLSCVHIPSSNATVPGRIKRSLAIVLRIL